MENWLTTEQIEAEVKRRYPKSEEEKRGCQSAKQIRNKMRSEYRERLISEGEAGIKQGVVQ